VVQVDLGQLFELTGTRLSEFLNDKLDEVFEHVGVIDEHLKQVFDSHSLVFLQLEVLELLHLELASILRVVYEGAGNVLHVRHHVVSQLRGRSKADKVALEGACLLVLLLNAFLEQLGPVNLETVNFLSKVVDFLLDNSEGLLPVLLIFDVDLDQQAPHLFVLGQLDGFLTS